MGKFTKLFVFAFLITILSTTSSYSQNPIYTNDFENGSTAISPLLAPCDPPLVTSPLYLCQNRPTTPINVTPSVGGTLSWYGTNAIGGIASATAPTPSTTTVGSTTYYVSQTIAACESPRVPIVVNVVADNGATILGLRCDPSQAAPNSVFFDWSNSPLLSSSYTYSYTIDGGPVVTGYITAADGTHLQVPGLLPGQSVTLTLTSTTSPCVPPVTITCSLACGVSTVTPNFAPIPAFCSGTAAPILANTSPNGIVGTWSPAVVSNTVSGSYVFTPNLILKPCATTQTLSITVTPKVTPTFASIPAIICQNSTPPDLPTNSTNTPAITGVWNPAIINTTTLGTTIYTFTPNPGQCIAAAAQPLSITIIPVVVANFASIPAFCSGTVAPTLPLTSLPPELITGTWSPPTISNTASGNYVFTPDPILYPCSETQTLNVIVKPIIEPDFDDITICLGNPAPILEPISPNGISGTWSPTFVDNTANGTYVFTPNVNECAIPKQITVTVNQATLVSFEWSVNDAFSENQIVTVIASATGNYLYQLDHGPLQSSPVFENVALGPHTITVYDANGCSPPITRDDILVINYPHFFTPNGDNNNETWNIIELRNQSNSKIFIFDRYGKLLKEISPRGLGWDGTYIGHQMPSTDYWFTVEYMEQNISKKFKAHFSLKR